MVRERGPNLHPLKDYHLKVARLPIPPLAHADECIAFRQDEGKGILQVSAGLICWFDYLTVLLGRVFHL